MSFKTGQKVVCIRPFTGLISRGYNVGKYNTITPKVGSIYTISEISSTGYLSLKEIPLNSFGNSCCFNDKKFEPLKLDYDFVEEVIKQVQPKEIA